MSRGMKNAWIYDEVPFEQYIARKRDQALFEARVQLGQVDYLGPANEEQRSERKDRRRAERRASLRDVGLTILADGIFGIGMLVGLVVGSLNPDLVLGVLR